MFYIISVILGVLNPYLLYFYIISFIILSADFIVKPEVKVSSYKGANFLLLYLYWLILAFEFVTFRKFTSIVGKIYSISKLCSVTCKFYGSCKILLYKQWNFTISSVHNLRRQVCYPRESKDSSWDRNSSLLLKWLKCPFNRSPVTHTRFYILKWIWSEVKWS